ncbi:uncharacterized protein METZ01_LOCUS107993, partial [marine metagenome]
VSNTEQVFDSEAFLKPSGSGEAAAFDFFHLFLFTSEAFPDKYSGSPDGPG